MTIKIITSAIILSVLPMTTFAGDPEAGKELYHEVSFERTIKGELMSDVNCDTCHQAEFYQREDRKATTIAKLNSWVEGCNTTLDVGWFPEDVSDVAAYLNKEYYHLKE